MKQRALHILLVEDDPDHAEITLHVLASQPAGHSTAHARDGEQALAYLRKEAGYEDAVTPNLILLDLKLPKLDGLEVLKEIKSTDGLKTVPVVMLTTSSSERDRLAAYNNYVNSYLVKPVSFDAFARVIEEVSDYWSRVNRGLSR